MWQNTKHGQYKQLNFKDFQDTENFIIELLDFIKKNQVYPRIEIEGRMVQIWITNNIYNQKVSNEEVALEENIDNIASKFIDLNIINQDIELKADNHVLSQEKVKLYADGGSRGNPGPSSSGFVILDQKNNIIVDKGVYLGLTTNNQAEYTALKLGLEECLKLKFFKVDVFMDSLLVINQMKGIYKIKNRELWPLHNHIKNLTNRFEEINFQHVPREFNKLADAAVNRALDEELNK